MNDTVQAEALPPDVLASEIDAAVSDVIDQDALATAAERGEEDRAEILRVLGGLTS
jgi:hypothetical protein